MWCICIIEEIVLLLYSVRKYFCCYEASFQHQLDWSFNFTIVWQRNKLLHFPSQSACRSQHADSGWVSKSPYCTFHCGFTAQQQHSSYLQPSGDTTAHHLRWGPFTWGEPACSQVLLVKVFVSDIFLIICPSFSGLQQFGRLPVLHQRTGLCWISSRHGHGILPSRRLCQWAGYPWGWGGTKQPALRPLWDFPSQLGGIHHIWSPWAAWGDPYGGEREWGHFFVSIPHHLTEKLINQILFLSL